MDASFTHAFVHEGIKHDEGYAVRPVVSTDASFPRCYVNRDGMVDVRDVASLARLLLEA